MNRPLFTYRPEKITYDKGTSDEQTVTYSGPDPYFVLFMDKLCWCLHEWSWRRGVSKYSGTGFYMSIPDAKRLYVVLRGKPKLSIFWGQRSNKAVIEFWRLTK